MHWRGEFGSDMNGLKREKSLPQCLGGDLEGVSYCGTEGGYNHAS
jgi:hypothetical protein